MNKNKCSALFFTLLVEKSPQALPMGAACVASAVKNNPLTKDLFSVRLFSMTEEDSVLAHLKEEEQAEVICKSILEKFSTASFICMSIYVWNKIILEQAAMLLKEKNPSLVLVAGGPEVTADAAKVKGFDFYVLGEGEDALPKLLHSLEKKEEIKIQGVYSFFQLNKTGTGEKLFLQKALPPEIEELTSPYLDKTISASFYGGALWELARGCPFKCSYCYESKGYAKIRRFPKERLQKELELFAKEKIPQVFVLDPTYNADKNRALEMLKNIKRLCPSTFFYFEARAEFIDKEIAKAFASIKCSVQFGLQSSSESVLKNVNRTFNKKQFVKNIGFLNEEGVVFGFDLIYGLPGDTLQGFKNSIDFALSLYPNNLELFCLSVLPGTALHESAPGFGLEWQSRPPYHVVNNPTFGKSDLQKAKRLSFATNIFYTKGRAVPYFNGIVELLKQKPSLFFENFASFLETKTLALEAGKNLSFKQIESLQKEFVCEQLNKKGLKKYNVLVSDILSLNAALASCEGEGEERTLNLSYHPDDLMSGYASDIAFFYENCGRQKNITKVFISKNGPDWKTV